MAFVSITHVRDPGSSQCRGIQPGTSILAREKDSPPESQLPSCC